MKTNYLTVMMKHFEHMNIEVAAAAESLIRITTMKEREDVFDCNRFVFVKEGTGTMYIQGEAVPLTKGTLCILLSGVRHRIAVKQEETLTIQWCHFRGSYEDRELYRTLKIPSYCQLIDDQRTIVLFEQMIEQLGQDKLTSRLRIKANMLEIISNYLDCLPTELEQDDPSEDLQKIDIVLNYIDIHLSDNITIEDLAKQVYLHPNYFIVFFKGILGYSPIQYVNQRRMEMAKSLLLQPECSVSVAAGKVGMKIYYFSRMFKAHTGLTPSRYRKQAIFSAATNNEPFDERT